MGDETQAAQRFPVRRRECGVHALVWVAEYHSDFLLFRGLVLAWNVALVGVLVVRLHQEGEGHGEVLAAVHPLLDLLGEAARVANEASGAEKM